MNKFSHDRQHNPSPEHDHRETPDPAPGNNLPDATASWPVAIGLGANLGQPATTIRQAVANLQKRGLRQARLSSLYLTKPVDCVPGTPDFVNAAVVGLWSESPHALLAACREIEQKLGRPSEHEKDEARTIDLDILLVGRLRRSGKKLTLPHPLLEKRLFVLIPLAEVAANWPVPGQGRDKTVAELAAEQQTLTVDPDRLVRRLWPKLRNLG